MNLCDELTIRMLLEMRYAATAPKLKASSRLMTSAVSLQAREWVRMILSSSRVNHYANSICFSKATIRCQQGNNP